VSRPWQCIAIYRHAKKNDSRVSQTTQSDSWFKALPWPHKEAQVAHILALADTKSEPPLALHVPTAEQESVILLLLAMHAKELQDKDVGRAHEHES
jgi:hypothetical protein